MGMGIPTPGRAGSPSHQSQQLNRPPSSSITEQALTAIDILPDHLRHRASIHLPDRLTLQRPPILTPRKHTTTIHRLLQTIILPTKQVIRMGSVAVAVAERQHKRVGILGLVPEPVEPRGIPERLVRHLRHADGVRCGTGTCWLEGFSGRVVHVALVVWGVEVLAVPAAVFSPR